MRILYVTTYDPNDQREWSGSGYAIMESLRMAGMEVAPMGPLRRNFRLISRLKGGLYRRLLRRSYHHDREALVGWDFARQINSRLQDGGYDLVFSPGAIAVSRLRCRQPIAIWADATWASYISHYGLEETLCRETVRAGHRTESSAFDRASCLIFASQWAATSAIADYGVDPTKVSVVPFGANFIDPPSRSAALNSIDGRGTDCCRLITIGLDWYRKGVPRAIELASELNRRGIMTKLTVVGSIPASSIKLPEFVDVVGYIDKRSIDGEKKISRLLAESHFHVLFSVAEAFGVVFAEANAHAVPNIASDIGGIESAVINRQGGQCFAATASIEQIADYVETHFLNRGRYMELAVRAREQYDSRLNWRAAGMAVRCRLEAAMQHSRTR